MESRNQTWRSRGLQRIPLGFTLMWPTTPLSPTILSSTYFGPSNLFIHSLLVLAEDPTRTGRCLSPAGEDRFDGYPWSPWEDPSARYRRAGVHRQVAGIVRLR